MEEFDAFIGFWIRDVPYIFEAATTNTSVFLQDPGANAERKYLIDYPEFKKISGEPCKKIQNYFKQNTSWLKTLVSYIYTFTPLSYKNGRVHYYTPDVSPNPKFEIIWNPENFIPSPLALALEKYNGIDFDLSSLICTQMAGVGSNNPPFNFDTILDIIKKCPPLSECDPCTKVGTKVAKSLIKIASLRIFADPEQSIMELPVNSLDAYSPDRKIGKFGMGFFSILYWLVGHPKREIIIHSFSKSSTSGESENTYEAYKVVIKEINGSLAFNLTTYPYSQITTTGFRVHINAKDDPFPERSVAEFENQLSKLNYASGATIYTSVNSANPLSLWDFRKADISNPGSGKNIFCYIGKSDLLVEDFATGVPLQILLGSLFVPSISSKTIQMSNSSYNFINNSRIESRPHKATKNTLLFLIGGIAVISITDDAFKTAGFVYIVDLPANTRLPVSRDDIILTDETEAILKQSISLVFDQASKRKDVSEFQTLLEKYIEFTPSTDNKNIVKGTLIHFYETSRSMLVPSAHKNLYEKLEQKFQMEANFIVSKIYDVSSVEEWLGRNIPANADIWYGIKVIVISGIAAGSFNTVTDGGLVSYLFIDEKYKNTLGAKWITTITTSYFQRKLYPVESETGKENYEKYETLTTTLPSVALPKVSVRNYYFAVLNKLESLENKFNMSPVTLKLLATDLLRFAEKLPEEQFMVILTELLAKFSSFKGNQTYGGGKYSLEYLNLKGVGKVVTTSGEEFEDYGIIPKEKIIPFTIEHILYSIRAVKEEPCTRLVTLTLNSPRSAYIWAARTFPEQAKFYIELMKQSVSFFEYQLVWAGAGRGFENEESKRNKGNKGNPVGLPGDLIRQMVTYFIEKMRNRHLQNRELVELYKAWNNGPSYKSHTTFSILAKDRIEAEEWIKTAQGISTIKTIAKEPLTRVDVKLRLSSLVRSLFKTQLPKGKLLDFYKSVSADAKKNEGAKGGQESNLQIIEIAVNEGTVKPFIEAVMTELTQNSIDAIREFNPEYKYIDINLTALDESESKKKDFPKTVILKISDLVGMSEEAFAYVSIPFLSTKAPSELVTGEMGSGFFNVYRESEKVDIFSVKDGIVRSSVDTPIRDTRGRTIDISKKIFIAPTDVKENFTNISVFIPVRDEAHYANIVSRVTYTARNVLGLALTKSISFNDENIYVPRDLSAAFGFFEIYLTNTIKHESYLLTNGVPFAPLSKYFKGILKDNALEMIDTQIILNITHGGYTPVQTRTRINVAPEVQKDFAKAALYCAFLYMVREVSHGHKLYALDHIDSTADPEQLQFSTFVLTPQNTQFVDESGYLKYVEFYDQPTLAQLINMCIKKLGKDVLNVAKRGAFLIEKYKSPYPHVNSMVMTIVSRWFLTKSFPKPDKPPKTKSPAKASKYKNNTVKELKDILKEKGLKLTGKKEDLIKRLETADESSSDGDETPHPPDVPDEQVTKIVKAWITTFWEIASSLKIVGCTGSVPKCFGLRSEKERGNLGYYNYANNSITINTFTWSEKDRKQIVDVVGATSKSKNVEKMLADLKKNEVWEKFFSYKVPSSTICHELEHARRKTEHGNQDGHDSTMAVLFPGDVRQTRTFNESSNLVFEMVLANGFYEKFLKAI